MARYDILLDDDDDLFFKNGDFVVGESDEQHIAHILVAMPGEYRQNPKIGFGIVRYLKKPDSSAIEFVRNMKVALAADGYTNLKIDATKGISNFELYKK